MSVATSYAISYSQESGADVVATGFVPLFTARVAGSLDAVKITCKVAPVGGDKKFTVDVKDCGGNSVLQSAVDFDAGRDDCEVIDGTISAGNLAEDDTIGVDIDVSGSTGDQGQGVCVTIYYSETT